MSRVVRWILIVCLTLEYTALGVWTGGLIVLIAAVIPAVFNTFGGQDAGGLFLTRSFDGYNRLVLAALAFVAAGAGCRTWMGHRGMPIPPANRSEWALFGVMAVIAAVIVFGLHPKATTLQAKAFAAQGEEARKAAFAAFFRLHWPIRFLYLLNLGLGIALIAVKVRSWIQYQGVGR